MNSLPQKGSSERSNSKKRSSSRRRSWSNILRSIVWGAIVSLGIWWTCSLLMERNSQQVHTALETSEEILSPDSRLIYKASECTRNKWKFFSDWMHDNRRKTFTASDWTQFSLTPRLGSLKIRLNTWEEYHFSLNPEIEEAVASSTLSQDEIKAINKWAENLKVECAEYDYIKPLSENFTSWEYIGENTYNSFAELDTFCKKVSSRLSQGKTNGKYDTFIKVDDVTIHFNWVDSLNSKKCVLESVDISFDNFYWESIRYHLKKDESFEIYFEGRKLLEGQDIPDLVPGKKIPAADEMVNSIIQYYDGSLKNTLWVPTEEQVPTGSLLNSVAWIFIPEELSDIDQAEILARLRVCVRDRWSFWQASIFVKKKTVRDKWPGKIYWSNEVSLDFTAWDMQVAYRLNAETKIQDIYFPHDEEKKREFGTEFIKEFTIDDRATLIDGPVGQEAAYMRAVFMRLLGSCEEIKQKEPGLASTLFGNESSEYSPQEWRDHSYISEELKKDQIDEIITSMQDIYGKLNEQWLLDSYISSKYKGGFSYYSYIGDIKLDFHITEEGDFRKVVVSYSNYYNDDLKHTISKEGDSHTVTIQANYGRYKSNINFEGKIPHTEHVLTKILNHLSPETK